VDLSLFPYPFSQDSGLNQSLFVLPDQLSSLDISNLMQLAVQMGTASQPEYISARVAYASEVDEIVRRNHHLILLGRPTENALFREVNTQLPHPFVPDSDLLEPLAVDTVAFLPDLARDAGLLELIDSPWNEAYSLLAITGTTDEGVRLAFQALLEQTGALEGDLAVIEPTFESLSGNSSTYYSIDVRPSARVNKAGEAKPTISEEDLILLTKRWWR
jgi:hypothetical protein